MIEFLFQESRKIASSYINVSLAPPTQTPVLTSVPDAPFTAANKPAKIELEVRIIIGTFLEVFEKSSYYCNFYQEMIRGPLCRDTSMYHALYYRSHATGFNLLKSIAIVILVLCVCLQC